MQQRDLMKRLYQEFRGDKEKACQAFAEAERRGEIVRKRGSEKNSPDQYARDLWSDGMRKGWIRE